MQLTGDTLALRRGNISDAAADAVREMILDGRLSPGERLNEVRLAEGLGVSRTPLREGLRLLAAEGAIDHEPRLGYFVRPLTLLEFAQIYDMRPLLDPEALRMAGVPDQAKIAKLEKLNARLAKASGASAVDLDDQWHMDLLAHCPNRVLVETIMSFARRTRRYEIALMRERRNVAQSTEDHSRVLAALRAGDIDRACAALKQNMKSGKAPIIEWLKQRTLE
jgi:DNA-binding GntR family transcriptional regulator